MVVQNPCIQWRKIDFFFLNLLCFSNSFRKDTGMFLILISDNLRKNVTIYRQGNWERASRSHSLNQKKGGLYYYNEAKSFATCLQHYIWHLNCVSYLLLYISTISCEQCMRKNSTKKKIYIEERTRLITPTLKYKCINWT